MKNKKLIQEYRRKIEQGEDGKISIAGKNKEHVPYVGTGNVDPIIDAVQDMEVPGKFEEQNYKTLIDFLNGTFELKKQYKAGEEREAIADLLDEKPEQIWDDDIEFLELWWKQTTEAWNKKSNNVKSIQHDYADFEKKFGISVSTTKRILANIASLIAYKVKEGMKDRGSQSTNYGDNEGPDASFSGDEDDAENLEMYSMGMDRAEDSGRGSAADWFSGKTNEAIEHDYLLEEQDGNDNEQTDSDSDSTPEEEEDAEADNVEADASDTNADADANAEALEEDDQNLDESYSSATFESTKTSVETFFAELETRIKSDRAYFEENIKKAKEIAEESWEEHDYKSAKEAEKDIKIHCNKRLKALDNFEKVLKGMGDDIVKQLNYLNREVQNYIKTGDQSDGFDDDFDGNDNVAGLF